MSYTCYDVFCLGTFIQELIESNLSNPWSDITMLLLPSTTACAPPQSHQIMLNHHLPKEVDLIAIDDKLSAATAGIVLKNAEVLTH